MENDRGSLKDTSIIKLVLSIFEQELTGILYLKYQDTLKTLYFSRGKLIWAVSNAEEDKLENILLTQGIIDPELLMKTLDEIDSPELLGKSMVEKGVITLEELIESSKIQLKKIIISILKWTECGFHFVRDNPPDRLLSLELNITDFIIDFILKEVGIDYIKKEIGSLQMVLIINPDDKKITKYNLSEKQNELLDNFKREENLEKILSKYSGGHQDSLLKIIYFFLIAELLIKKQTELVDSSLFVDETTLEDFGVEKNETVLEQKSQGINVPNVEEDISYVFRNAVDSDQTKEEVVEESIDLPTSPEEAPPLFSQEVNTEKRKKIKFINIILLFFTLIISGVILLYIAGVFNNDSKNTSMTTKDDGTFVDDKEAKPKTQKQNIKNGETPPTVKNKDTKTTEQDTTQITVMEKKDKPAVKDPPKTDKTKTGKPEVIPLKKVETQPKVEPEKTEKKPAITTGKSAMTYFQDGDMTTAGTIWNQDLKKENYKFSILLEMDCLQDSVIRAYEQISDKEKFFILNKQVGERGCFLVMWGFFNTWEAAEEGMRSIPQYFKNQQYPPRVVELPRYLQ